MARPREPKINPGTLKAVVFDLDGTLLDTLGDLQAAVNHVMASHGWPARSLEQVRGDLGYGNVRLMELSLPVQVEDEVFSQLMEEFRTYYRAHMDVRTKPYEGIGQALSALHAVGLRLAVVSNKFDAAVKGLVEQYFGDRFQAVYGEDEAHGYHRKPAPDLVNRVMAEFKLKPADCCYVGDSEVDIQTAANAGLPCVSVCWGFRTEEQLRESHARYVAHDPMELLHLLLGV